MAKSNDFTEADLGLSLAVSLGWRQKTSTAQQPDVIKVRKPLAALARNLDEDLIDYSTELNRLRRRGASKTLLLPKPESKSYTVLKTAEQVYLAMMDIAHGYTKPSDYRFAEHLDVDNILYHVDGPAGNLTDRLGDCYFWAKQNLPNRWATNVFRHPDKSESPSTPRTPRGRVADLGAVVHQEKLRYAGEVVRNVPVFAPKFP
jgi:hypothetical protein